MSVPIDIALKMKLEFASGMGPWVDLYIESEDGTQYAIASIPFESEKVKDETVALRVVARKLEQVFR